MPEQPPNNTPRPERARTGRTAGHTAIRPRKTAAELKAAREAWAGKSTRAATPTSRASISPATRSAPKPRQQGMPASPSQQPTPETIQPQQSAPLATSPKQQPQPSTRAQPAKSQNPLIQKYLKRLKPALFAVVLVLLLLLAVSVSAPSCNFEALEAKTAPAENYKVSCSQSQAAAVGTLEYGLASTCGDTGMKPTASTIKTLTALVVLNKISEADLKNVITLGFKDVEYFNQTKIDSGSHIRIWQGEQLTLKQMLEGMMLQSANNLAQSLADHVFGGQEQYKAAAEEYLKAHNLTHTQIGADASGLDEGTMSTATDMFEISRLALRQKTLAEIVQEKSVDFPPPPGTKLAKETITNINPLLKQGYIGIKGGYTNEAGWSMLFAAPTDDYKYTIVGVSLHNHAVNDPTGELIHHEEAIPITQSMESALKTTKFISAGDVIGKVHYVNVFKKWDYDIVAEGDFSFPLVGDQRLHYDFNIDDGKSKVQVVIRVNGEQVGEVSAHFSNKGKPNIFTPTS